MTPPVPSAPTGIAYKVEFVGIDDKALVALLEANSSLVSLAARPPKTLSGLARRARTDLPVLTKVMKSEGYYASAIDSRIESDRTPVQVRVEITPGPRYLLQRFDIEYSGSGADDDALPGRDEVLALPLGSPARAELVSNAKRMLLRKLSEVGHPLAAIVDEQIYVHHADRSMSVVLRVQPGALSRFGALNVVGLESVEKDYVLRLVPWEEGEIYDVRKTDELRDRLLDTSLFNSVVIERANSPSADTTLAVTARLGERKHRSISLGAWYATDEGIGGRATWEHRNLLGRQERLLLSAEIAEIRQGFDASFTKPNFRRLGQSLLADASFGNEETDAFTGPLATGFAGLERPLSTNWVGAVGIPVENSNLKDARGTREFFLYGLALRGERDSSDDRLDPTSGTRLRLSLTPYRGNGDSDVTFLVSDIRFTAYYSPLESRRFTLAGKLRLGSVVGEDTATLPANKRLYAGGASSIRGYAFQSVGPLSPTNQPLGGRSLLEIGAELRAKVSRRIGAAVFVEAGNAYDERTPDFDLGLQWAAGVGARYFSGVGPLRLDFGFPLNRRSGVDDVFQFYLSIGQAF